MNKLQSEERRQWAEYQMHIAIAKERGLLYYKDPNEDALRHWTNATIICADSGQRWLVAREALKENEGSEK